MTAVTITVSNNELKALDFFRRQQSEANRTGKPQTAVIKFGRNVPATMLTTKVVRIDNTPAIA